jgi:membrane-associated phospholipid phosphatase
VAGSTVLAGRAQETWFDGVNAFARATPWLHGPMRAFAEYGVALFAVLLLLSWWSARGEGLMRRVAASLWAPLGVLVALALNQVLVARFAEARPFTVLPHALVLVSRSSDYSFPSDHAVMAGAAAAGILLVHRRLGLVTAGLAVLMAFTRVYVGAHFPLDVVVGLAVGALVVVAGWLALGGLLTSWVVLLARTPARPLLTTAAR